jgi:hypothetical protein
MEFVVLLYVSEVRLGKLADIRVFFYALSTVQLRRVEGWKQTRAFCC